jgi:hypothetical protein
VPRCSGVMCEVSARWLPLNEIQFLVVIGFCVVCVDRRRLSGAGRANIRIVADTSQLTLNANFSSAQRSFLTSSVLPVAISNLTSLLLVDPVSGNLTATRDCTGYVGSGANAGKCSSYSTSLPSCGSVPPVSIPLSYIADTYTGCTNNNDVSSGSVYVFS